MLAEFSFELDFYSRHDLRRQFKQAQFARSEIIELRARLRQTVAQSHELMASIDRQLAPRPPSGPCHDARAGRSGRLRP
jgi:hypothetical protein